MGGKIPLLVWVVGFEDGAACDCSELDLIGTGLLVAADTDLNESSIELGVRIGGGDCDTLAVIGAKGVKVSGVDGLFSSGLDRLYSI